jgi:hypothetical protein
MPIRIPAIKVAVDSEHGKWSDASVGGVGGFSYGKKHVSATINRSATKVLQPLFTITNAEAVLENESKVVES